MSLHLMLTISGGTPGAPEYVPDLPPPWNTDSPLTLETYDGVGDTIHPSVVDMGLEGWNGYRYWLVDTPYAEADNQLENPCVWAGNEVTDFIVPEGVVNPLSPPPGASTGFHSDPEMAYDSENDRMVIWYRTTLFNNPDGPWTIHIHALTSNDGVTWVDEGPVHQLPLEGGRLSPAVVRMGPGDWRMWLWGSYQNTCVMLTADNPLGPWGNSQNTTLNGMNLLGWHGDVIHHDGLYYMIYSDDYMLKFQVATSPDGIEWTRPDQPVVMERRQDDWDVNLYRPTLSVDPEPGVFRLWYSAISPPSPGGHAIGYTRLPISAWT